MGKRRREGRGLILLPFGEKVRARPERSRRDEGRSSQNAMFSPHQQLLCWSPPVQQHERRGSNRQHADLFEIAQLA